MRLYSVKNGVVCVLNANQDKIVRNKLNRELDRKVKTVVRKRECAHTGLLVAVA